MTTVEIVETNAGQLVFLPEGFRFATRSVSIERVGDAILLTPLKPDQWPANFFDEIRIDDPTFVRAPQGAF